ncbi:MAG: M14 family metallopeptidase [Alishewanella sp.]|nr:M14 family metallopeptidase [Alishewanella sp.]
MPLRSIFVVALLFSSASWAKIEDTTAAVAKATASCVFSSVSFTSDFPMGRLDGCQQTGVDSFTLHLKPENLPINPSPWYAFKVIGVEAQPKPITITLMTHNGPARYSPKVSLVQQVWAPVAFSKTDQSMQFKLSASKTPIYVAAGEIINNVTYTRWLSDLEQGHIGTLGLTVENRAIPMLEHRTPNSQDWLILIGRQHPPEITGALALLHFNNLLWSDDPTVSTFRSRYNILLVPNMNPDGVHRGNWRHNRNGLDLNRDWKNRSQPETQALHTKLKAIEAEGGVIRFALDFHSTNRNVYYTMDHDYVTAKGKPLAQPQLVNNWLSSLAERVPYKIENRPSHNQDSGVFKQYMADEFGVHSVTYEVGDDTDRAEIKVMAEAALRTLIEHL